MVSALEKEMPEYKFIPEFIPGESVESALGIGVYNVPSGKVSAVLELIWDRAFEPCYGKGFSVIPLVFSCEETAMHYRQHLPKHDRSPFRSAAHAAAG